MLHEASVPSSRPIHPGAPLPGTFLPRAAIQGRVRTPPKRERERERERGERCRRWLLKMHVLYQSILITDRRLARGALPRKSGPAPRVYWHSGSFTAAQTAAEAPRSSCNSVHAGSRVRLGGGGRICFLFLPKNCVLRTPVRTGTRCRSTDTCTDTPGIVSRAWARIGTAKSLILRKTRDCF